MINVAIQITLDGAKRIHDLRRITASRTGSLIQLFKILMN